MTAGRQDGRQAATVPIGYRLNCLRLTIFAPKFSTINTSFNLYMILNSYKSYIVASLSVRSTAVPAVTAEQSDGDLDGGGYRNIPLKVEVFILPRKIVLSYTNDFLPVKVGVAHKNWQKKRAELIRSSKFPNTTSRCFISFIASVKYMLGFNTSLPACLACRYVSA